MTNRKPQSVELTGKAARRQKKKLQMAGAGLLIVAFVLQNYFLSVIDGSLREADTASAYYSQTYLASLAYLNTYFVQGQSTQRYNGAVLTKAAQENFAGLTASLNVSGVARDDLKRKLVALSKQASAVTDLDTYNTYITAVNTVEAEVVPLRIARRERLDYWRGILNHTYLALSMLASVLLWQAYRYDG